MICIPKLSPATSRVRGFFIDVSDELTRRDDQGDHWG
jgi:hypothetical protein